MITITTTTLWISLIIALGLIGWFLSWREYEAKVKKDLDSKDAIKKLIDSQIQDKSDLAKKAADDIKRLNEKHAGEVDKINLANSEAVLKLVKDYEDKLKSAIDVRAEDLEESEKLVKERIDEIQSVYQSAIDDQNASLLLYEKYIKNFDACIQLSDKKLKEIDARGTFETDDEVGIFFTNLKYMQQLLNNFKIDKETLDEEQSTKLEETKA